ncbi:MAG: acyl-CoA thioesterase [Bdellovibrionaceae bacterium]|nr:acyl-CoA thioesterase [Pseudobdellovibrionaceae bacterium]
MSNFRVSFLDLDLNFHMNNGRFFSVMDLGRFDMLMRTGHFYKLFRNGYYPVVLSESMVFKNALNYLQKYEVHTQLKSWDKNFIYITQKFIHKENVIASANVRACFKKRGRRGIVSPKELYSFVGEEHVDSQLTELAKKQIELDNILLPR